MSIHTHDLADLARISLTEEEHVKYAKDIESILTFIDTIQTLTVHDSDASQSIGMAPVGVLRADCEIIREDEYTASEIVAQAPQQSNEYVQVKKILNQ